MRFELRLIGPVFLVLLAGYLTTSSLNHDLSFSSFFSTTGAAITDQSGTQSCPTEKILFRVSGQGNTHAALWNQASYTHAVCWDGVGATASQRACNTTGGNVVLRLSDTTNAHVENKELTTYQQRVCFGNIQCTTLPQGQCSTLGPTWRCAASLSAETNAHVADCGIYPFDLCCSDGSTSGGSQYRYDTDLDGVYDLGLNATRNTPCNPRVHSNFSICADNCINTPNSQQEDQDGDGAGDVCDAFVSDSCSIQQFNDNCPHLQQCRDLTAQWSLSSVSEGDPAGLTVTGSGECGGNIAHFQVFDRANHNLLTLSPQPSTFGNSSSTSVSSSWIGEYHLNQSNEYYFQVTVTGGSSQVQVSSSRTALLTVQQRMPGQAVCGNGRVEGSNNESCDDGNARNNDGCSSNCTLEGNFVGGQGCRDDLQCHGVPATFMVCRSDQTQAYFCLTGPGGCKQLSTPISCSRQNGVQQVCAPGADSCRSPTCRYEASSPSACVNGQQTITCAVTSGGNHCQCPNDYPRTVSCIPSREEEPFPVFTGLNFLVTILLLITFYTFRRGVSWKSE